MSFRFKTLAKRMIEVEERIAKEKGPLNLFALLQRWGSYHHMDVVIAANWAYPDKAAIRRYLYKVFEEELEPEEESMLGAFLVMNPKDDDVRAASRFGHVEHGHMPIHEDAISWRAFRRAYFITNSWPATEEETGKTRKQSKKATKTGSAGQRAASRRAS